MPHTVRRAGAATMPANSAVNVSSPCEVKHGRNPSSSRMTDRGRLSARRTGGAAKLWPTLHATPAR
jgi:hypothetical protein